MNRSPPPPPPPGMVKKYKWKLTPAPKGKLKGFQWSKLNPKDADKTIFKKFQVHYYYFCSIYYDWFFKKCLRSQEAPLDGFKFDFNELEQKFAVAPVKTTDAKSTKKDDGVANVLDGKISQNLSIWLSQYKDKTHAHVCE